MGDSVARKAFSHAPLLGNVQFIMLTQNSETESEHLNLTLEPRSDETRIKSVC